MKLSLLFATCLSVASVPAPAEDDLAVRHGELGERMHRYLDRLARLGFSGSVVVADGEHVLLAEGYGSADRGGAVANTPRTVVSLGSITKHFTAATVLRLEMDEVLSTDDTLDVFFADIPADKRGITLHQLLCHMSGLPDSTSIVGSSGSRAEFVASVMRTPLAYGPGTGMEYSNMGFGLLAAVIETVTGADYEDVVDELVFTPAGMTRSGLESELWTEADLAHGYIDGRDVGTLLSGDGPRNWGIRGSGGLHSTVYDMLRWSRALDAGAVLSPAALDKMLTPHGRMGPGTGYGYGTGVGKSVRGTKRIGHSGSNDVFCALFRWYPEDGLTIHVQSNDADVYAEDVAPILEQIVFGEEVSDPPDVIALDAAELAAYAGTYTLASGAEIEVVAEPGRLLIGSGSAEGAALIHPVRPAQVTRRDQLIEQVASAFTASFEGDLAPLHALIDPFAPFEEFADMHAQRMDRWIATAGPFRSARAVPGRNRFGEIAMVAVLEHERDTLMIEYSFGQGEVGSIRGLDAFPERVLRPVSTEEFVAYDVGSANAWRVVFTIEDGTQLPMFTVLNEQGEKRVARHQP
jgi:CubicO group peptidase (beta-lactamase class C family)